MSEVKIPVYKVVVRRDEDEVEAIPRQSSQLWGWRPLQRDVSALTHGDCDGKGVVGGPSREEFP